MTDVDHRKKIHETQKSRYCKNFHNDETKKVLWRHIPDKLTIFDVDTCKIFLIDELT